MIQILFFGRIADLVMQRSQSLKLPEAGLSLMALREQIFATVIEGGQLSPLALKMSVNQTLVSGDQTLQAGDEVAFFSPFSGG